jgi:hypothetical protein
MDAIARLLFGAVVATVFANGAGANEYAKCILDNAPAIQNATDNALDVIMLSCIKLHEEPINELEISEVKIQSSIFGEIGNGLGLIELIRNGSNYDITSITFTVKNKKTKTTDLYRYNQFINYHRGPGIVTGFPAPQYRRFIKAQTSGEYVFPLDLPGLEDWRFFNDRYELAGFTARGVR